ncbi:MAG: rhodanese-like domain-containing protein [Gammaproteobacteria bacterium]|nr:rhodanese-like domain-containing protein [Gammaproteobacteria bacterium]
MRHPCFRSIVIIVGLIILLSLPLTHAAEQDDEFPGRKLYPDISYITLKEFSEKLKNNGVMVVDVRSPYEFRTLHINSANNISLSSKKFISEMQKLRKSSVRPIVVYCNGKTRMKSYEAARKSLAENIADIVVYDAGIMDFAQSYPKDVELLGKKLNDTSKLISIEEFKKHLISPDEFSERVAETSGIVLDVRERFQREGLSVFIGRESRVSLNNQKRLDRYIKKAKTQDKTLLVYDQSGKQVRWLQYYLEEKGVNSYYFMKGGMHAYYETIQMDLKK